MVLKNKCLSNANKFYYCYLSRNVNLNYVCAYMSVKLWGKLKTIKSLHYHILKVDV